MGSTPNAHYHLSVHSTDVNHVEASVLAVCGRSAAGSARLGDEGVRFEGGSSCLSRQVPGSRRGRNQRLAGSKDRDAAQRGCLVGSRSLHGQAMTPRPKLGLQALLMPFRGHGEALTLTGETTKHACGFEMKQ